MLVYVTITDINDNWPFFPQCLPGKEFHFKVCEVDLQEAGNAFRGICFERHLVVKDVNSPSQPWYLVAYNSNSELHLHFDDRKYSPSIAYRHDVIPASVTLAHGGGGAPDACTPEQSSSRAVIWKLYQCVALA
jgi:hypothetical protein